MTAPRLYPSVLLLAVLIVYPANVQSADADPRATIPLPTIAPRTPQSLLLPVAPKSVKVPVYLGDDLTRVPEVMFEALPSDASKDTPTTPQWVARKARTAAAVLHLNAKEEDGFLKAMVRARPDLSGMPFRMGKECRTDENRTRSIKYTAEQMHKNEEPSFYLSLRNQRAHIAVMSQNLIGHDTQNQSRALRALTSTRQTEATRELARAAVFSPDASLPPRPSRHSPPGLLRRPRRCSSTVCTTPGRRSPSMPLAPSSSSGARI